MRPIDCVACLLAAFSFWSATSASAANTETPITEFVLPTEGAWPQAIITGPDGNLWCVESRKRKVIRITPKGEITEFTVPGEKVLLLQGITTGADGNLWFTSPSDNTIRRISPRGECNGEFKIPTVSTKMGSSWPRGIVTGPDGNVWFAELYGNKIARITPKGEITEFPVPTPDSGPYIPAFDKSGAVWFCESTAGKIGRLDPASKKVEEFALANVKCLPRDMTRGPDGNLWFSENQADRIGRITTKGEITEFDLPKGSRPVGITGGPDGNIWFSGFGTSQIGRLTADGKVTMFDTPTAKAQPFGLTVGPDGNIWFAAQARRIGRLDLKAVGK
jgi:virginiamycin B lyase